MKSLSAGSYELPAMEYQRGERPAIFPVIDHIRRNRHRFSLRKHVVSNGFYDLEYDPKPSIPNFADYFSRWKEEAVEARETATVNANLAYGPSAEETLDYFPADMPGAPLLVFIHGGYWRAFHKDDFSWIAPAYVAAGVSVAVVNYALLPSVGYVHHGRSDTAVCRVAV